MINTDRIHVAMTKTCRLVETSDCQSNNFNLKNQTEIKKNTVVKNHDNGVSSLLSKHQQISTTSEFDDKNKQARMISGNDFQFHFHTTRFPKETGVNRTRRHCCVETIHG